MNRERDIAIIVSENINRYWDRDNIKFSDCAKTYGNNTTQFKDVLAGRKNMNIRGVRRLAELFDVNTISMFEDWSDDECK